jgi:Flp pilus assembly protein TadG
MIGRWSHLPALLADRRGAVLPIVASGMVAMGGIAALAVDVSRAYSVQNELQTAVDAATLAAARDLSDPALALRTAQRIIETRFPRETHGTVLDAADFVVGTWDPEGRRFTADGTPNGLRLTVRRATANGNPEPTSFGRLIGYPTLDLEASATATVGSSLPLCLLALNPTAKNALEAAGSSQLVADDCVVYSNSNDTDAIHARSNASITASAVCAHGGVKGAHRITPVPATGCPRLADPLAALPTPTRWPTNHCDHTNGTFGPGTFTLSPGVYCGGIEVKADTTVTLQPGVYQIVGGGSFKATSGSRVVGDGVHINVGSGAGSGTIDLRGTPELELSAPLTGDYAGVVLYADRSQSGRTHYITGNANMDIDGTLYAPTGSVEFTGNSRAAITMLVADTIKFNGNSSFQRRAHLTDVPIPSGFAGLGAATRVMLVN